MLARRGAVCAAAVLSAGGVARCRALAAVMRMDAVGGRGAVFLGRRWQSGPAGAPEPTRFLQHPLRWLGERKGQFKSVMMQYSALGIVFYFGLYAVTLGSVYGLVRAEVVRIPDPTPTLRRISLLRQRWGDDFQLSPFWYQFLGAWLLTKTTEPVRLVVTLAALPWLARRLPPHVLRAFGVRIVEGAKTAAHDVKVAAQDVQHRAQEVRARMQHHRSGSNKPPGEE
jgi:Protein of unknown function (DUF1279)